jgi:NADH dehydrogenase
MILVTGGTGFAGRALVRQLVASGQRVRTLIRPSPRTPDLPRGVPVEVAVVALNDERGLRAALRGVNVIYHLAGAEQQGARANLMETDARGTYNLARAAADAQIERFFFLSHLGADRSSAFPILKVKGIAEDHIRKSGVPFTIFRSSILYGPEDHFTTGLAKMAAGFPILFMPRDGSVLLQPLWVEDLVTCMIWSLDNPESAGQAFEVGGSEYFSFREIAQFILNALGKRRLFLPLGLPYLRALTVTLEASFPGFPSSALWIDYLSLNRTCPVDTIPRTFGFFPARFSHRLDHLKSVNWTRELWRTLFVRHG